MLISKLSIENYKSFYTRQEIHLDKGFNLFIGRNNSGKTSTLELLTQFSYINEPHRSELSLPNYNDQPKTGSEYSVTIDTSLDELREIYGNRLYIPARADILYNPTLITKAGNEIGNSKIEIQYTFSKSPSIKIKNSSTETKSLTTNSGTPCIEAIFSENGNIDFFNAGEYALFQKYKLENFKNLCYRFSAVRHPKSTYGMDIPELKPDSSNLAYCINHLHSKDIEGHRLWCELINRIFPEIKTIQSWSENSNFTLMCYPVSPQKRRDDLAISLDKMGTGIGNIAAILYIIITSRSPKLVAIDEPNLFLHPKALRELLQILKSHGPQHQYVLTGHSPDILTSIEPSTITYFDIQNSESVTRSIKNNEFHKIRSELSDLGIRMTELHARDRVLWVEGQTEEIVFPKLLNAFFPEYAAGTAVLRVSSTGTFETKKGMPPNEVADAYKRLTNQSLVPPLVTILLDKESRKPQEIQDLLSKSKILKILPVKMIENYVIDIDAIHYVMAKHESTSKKEEIVLGNFDKATSNGAELLKTIFSNSKPTTIEYRKTTHTSELFDWIIDNKPELLNDLRDFIKKIFEEAQS